LAQGAGICTKKRKMYDAHGWMILAFRIKINAK
jgi:hypothetical protein